MTGVPECPPQTGCRGECRPASATPYDVVPLLGQSQISGQGMADSGARLLEPAPSGCGSGLGCVDRQDGKIPVEARKPRGCKKMARCPNCDASSRDDPEAFTVEETLIWKPLTAQSLAGGRLKLSGRWVARLSCHCGWSFLGEIRHDEFWGVPGTQQFPAKEKS